jgi:hypothetical protein
MSMLRVKIFNIKALENSEDAKYIESAKVNG